MSDEEITNGKTRKQAKKAKAAPAVASVGDSQLAARVDTVERSLKDVIQLLHELKEKAVPAAAPVVSVAPAAAPSALPANPNTATPGSSSSTSPAHALPWQKVQPNASLATVNDIAQDLIAKLADKNSAVGGVLERVRQHCLHPSETAMQNIYRVFVNSDMIPQANRYAVQKQFEKQLEHVFRNRRNSFFRKIREQFSKRRKQDENVLVDMDLARSLCTDSDPSYSPTNHELGHLLHFLKHWADGSKGHIESASTLVVLDPDTGAVLEYDSAPSAPVSKSSKKDDG